VPARRYPAPIAPTLRLEWPGTATPAQRAPRLPAIHDHDAASTVMSCAVEPPPDVGDVVDGAPDERIASEAG
jgi:hypothetical protein